MFDFPVKASFNRTIPKTKCYEKLAINSAYKNVFVNEIVRIVWRNKLSITSFLLKNRERYMVCMGFKNLEDQTISEYFQDRLDGVRRAPVGGRRFDAG